MKNQRCPFCGHDIQTIRTEYDRGVTRAWLECEECHAYGPPVLVEHPDLKYTQHRDEAMRQAIAKWNLRIVGRGGE